MGDPGRGQRGESGDGKRNPWKFPIETGAARPKEHQKGTAQRGAPQYPLFPMLLTAHPRSFCSSSGDAK